MLIKPVLNVIRVRTHTFGLAALLMGGCSVMPNERETLRIERVKEAVPPMARIALEAEQPTYERTGEPTDGCDPARRLKSLRTIGLTSVVASRLAKIATDEWTSAACVPTPW